eukprot:c15405_g2_i1 orf=89-280(+)
MAGVRNTIHAASPVRTSALLPAHESNIIKSSHASSRQGIMDQITVPIPHHGSTLPSTQLSWWK